MMNTFSIFPEKYPFLLKQLSKIPPLLYAAGMPPPDDSHKFLCVVGARKHSEYGLKVCRELIKGLRGYPIVIISGLAHGIDSIAHKAAIEYGLKTIAMPGSGISEQAIYPPSHLYLANEIIASGNTLLSPFAPERTGARWTFPVRNQLMAGLSHAVLVIEGRQGSGTLLTADYASKLGRDVMAVPGSIFSELSYGPHYLILQGVTPIFSSRCILEALGLEVLSSGPADNIQDIDLSNFTPHECLILKELQFKPQSASDLILSTRLTASHFNIAASKLEISGVISQAGGVFRLVRS